MIDRADGDLWVMAYGTKNFEEAPADRRRARRSPRCRRRAWPRRSSADRRLHRLAQADRRHRPSSVVIGADAEDGGLQPWNVVEGDVTGLGARDAVIVDKTYLEDLGLNGVGDTAQIGASPRARRRRSPRASARSRVTPYVFTTLNRARAAARHAGRQDHLRCWSSCEPGADVRSRARGAAQAAARQRGADQGRVPRPQPQPLAVLRPAPAWR